MIDCNWTLQGGSIPSIGLTNLKWKKLTTIIEIASQRYNHFARDEYGYNDEFRNFIKNYKVLLDKSKVRYKQVIYPPVGGPKNIDNNVNPVAIELIVDDVSQLQDLINNIHRPLLLRKNIVPRETDAELGIMIKDKS